ncbi:MAG: PadR family transcriptional regulator [Candidatus Thorarchaeota archaeon]
MDVSKLLKQDQADHEFDHIRMPHSVPRGLLRLVIIRLLQSQEMTGTGIMTTLAERSEGQWKPSPGSIYPLLASLEEEGIIKTVRTEGRKKTYALSKEGRSHTKEILKRKHDVEHRSRLNRMIWLQLLEPADRARFYVGGIVHASEHLSDTIKELTDSERRRLRKQVMAAAETLASLLDTLE